jgi:hypothetical protein
MLMANSVYASEFVHSQVPLPASVLLVLMSAFAYS